MDNNIGIDVAKASLQIYIPRDQLDLEIVNSKTGLNHLCKQLKKISHAQRGNSYKDAPAF